MKCISASRARRSAFPIFTGSTRPIRDNLLAATHDLEEMRAYIGCDSLGFLSIEGLYRAMGEKARDPRRPQFTDHCFTGDYPTPLTDVDGTSGRFGQGGPKQLSLLAEAG